MISMSSSTSWTHNSHFPLLVLQIISTHSVPRTRVQVANATQRRADLCSVQGGNVPTRRIVKA